MMMDDIILQKLKKIWESRDYWGNVGAGVLLKSDTGKYLLSLRSDGVQEPGTWGIIGGKLDEYSSGAESPREAAAREFQEEMGIRINPNELKLLYTFKDEEDGDVVFTYYNFIYRIEEFDTSSVDLNWESDEIRWFTKDEVLRLPNKHFGLEELIQNTDEFGELS